MSKTPFTSLALLGALILVSGCARDPRFDPHTVYLPGTPGVYSTQKRAPFDNVSYWDGEGVSGTPSVRISLGEQKAFFYKGGELVGISMISTGREGLETPSGTFKIIQKDKDHKSSQFGDYVDSSGQIIKKDIDLKVDPKPPGAIFDGAKMPYFMRIVGGTGMHAGFLPGYPASHGCIRMPEFMAEAFFRNISTGTPVTIVH